MDGEGGMDEDSSVAPTGWEEQDGEEFAGGRWVCGKVLGQGLGLVRVRGTTAQME